MPTCWPEKARIVTEVAIVDRSLRLRRTFGLVLSACGSILNETFRAFSPGVNGGFLG